ncbi:hypothetical protein HZA97_03520 [Candidatus Woesearchaeota archaeon]|nr:hypothetical protein [Candidatus Woesearchaeota archaeon]
MSLLNELFASTETVSELAEKDEKLFFESWQEYLSTLKEKEQVINQLPFLFGQKENHLKRLKQLLDLELVDLSQAEQKEAELISNIQSLKHSERMKKIHKLEVCLDNAETQINYVYKLLRYLFSALKIESAMLEKLVANRDLRKYRTLINDLKSELLFEQSIAKRIKETKDLRNLFSALVKGEHLVARMDAKEQKLLKKIQKGMSKILSGELKEGITYEWAVEVLNKIEDKTYDLVAEGIYINTPNVLFEFVNGPEFVDLAKEVILELKIKSASEEMINVFVHLFREWYNDLE